LAKQPRHHSPFDQALQPPNGPLLQQILQQCIVAELDMGSCSVSADSVNISGTSPDWDRCTLLDQALQKAGYETKLKREDAGADERVHFTIKGISNHAG